MKIISSTTKNYEMITLVQYLDLSIDPFYLENVPKN